MFDFDAGKIIIVGVIALIFIPPKDLPRVLRQVGQFVGKMRRMAAEFQGQFMDAMREADLADLKAEAQKLSDAARASTGLDSLHDLNGQMTSALDRPGATVAEPIGRVDSAATAPRAVAQLEATGAEPGGHAAAQQDPAHHDLAHHEAGNHASADHASADHEVAGLDGARRAETPAHQSA